MTGLGWSLVEVAAQLLECNEREVVLGDLVEAGRSTWQGLPDVIGLVIRRQVILWKNWRPWLAAFGLALPSSFLLMGFSLSVSQAYQRFIDPAIFKMTGLTLGAGFWLLLCNICLLVGWAWTGGFVVGSVSRRTVWVSVALFLPVFVLFGQVPLGISVQVLPAPLFAPCDLGSSPRFTNRSDQIEFSNPSSGGRNRIDNSHMEQQRSVDSQLGVELAGVVSGRDGTATWPRGRTKVKCWIDL